MMDPPSSPHHTQHTSSPSSPSPLSLSSPSPGHGWDVFAFTSTRKVQAPPEGRADKIKKKEAIIERSEEKSLTMGREGRGGRDGQ